MRNARAVTWLLAGAVLCAACADSPTEPLPVLTLSATEVSLVRSETRALTASATVQGSGTDVTSVATWRSSDTQVATVVAGLVSAVGPGTATITAEHGPQTRQTAVTVHRRTSLAGQLRAATLDGTRTVAAMTLYVDGTEAGGSGTSSSQEGLTVRFVTDRERTAAASGAREIRVRIASYAMHDGSQATFSYALRWIVPVTVLDRDTGDTLATLELGERTVTVGTPAEIVWNVTIPAFKQ